MVRSIVLTVLLLGGCGDSTPSSCSDAACDGAHEYCVLFGSDVPGESEVAVCEPLPAGCDDAPSCDCLRDLPPSSGVCFDLAFTDGACQARDGVVELTCPAG
jgi:hypothetical protein